MFLPHGRACARSCAGGTGRVRRGPVRRPGEPDLPEQEVLGVLADIRAMVEATAEVAQNRSKPGGPPRSPPPRTFPSGHSDRRARDTWGRAFSPGTKTDAGRCRHPGRCCTERWLTYAALGFTGIALRMARSPGQRSPMRVNWGYPGGDARLACCSTVVSLASPCDDAVRGCGVRRLWRRCRGCPGW
jgi:hypothetical protein